MKKLLGNLIILMLLALSLFARSANGQACTHYASPSGGGSGNSQGSPFLIGNFMSIASPGNVLCLLDGTYTNNGDKIELGSSPSGTPGNPITIRALNDGGAYINGQNARRIFFFNGTSYWTVKGIDFGNSGDQYSNAMDLTDGAHHITVQRVCVWNTRIPTAGVYSNQHTFGLENSHHNVFEDICAFGYGRNTFIPFEDQTKDNVFRRIWLRWDGYPDGAGGQCGGPTIQTQYHTHHSNDIYENFISIFSGGLYKGLYSGPGDSRHQDGYPCPSLGAGWVTRTGMSDGVPGPYWLGQIFYGYSTNNDIMGNGEGAGMASRYTAMHIADAFVDSRWSRLDNKSFNIYSCDVADPSNNDLAVAGSCSQLFIDRVTSVINPGQATGTLGPSGANLSNIHECTSLASCPNFYTGGGPSTGSRSCFEYSNGTLTSTPLWPWRMDDRIKQAISRSGIGPTLSGAAGSGYAANTVTSEIVSRYGAIPSQCLRDGGGPPPPAIVGVSWWKFDENGGTTAADSSGNNHTITLNSGAGWGPPQVGVSSLRCNGTTIGPSTADVIFDNPLYTWMAWIKGDAAPSNAIFNSPFANGPTNAGTDAWGLWWSSQDGTSATVQSIFHRDSTGLRQLKIPITLSANVWYHLAATFDGSTVQLYVNGQPQGSFPASTPVAPDGAPQVCGRYFPTPWAGNIDEFRIDNRAWTAAEILSAYGGTPTAPMTRRRVVPQ